MTALLDLQSNKYTPYQPGHSVLDADNSGQPSPDQPFYDEQFHRIVDTGFDYSGYDHYYGSDHPSRRTNDDGTARVYDINQAADRVRNTRRPPSNADNRDYGDDYDGYDHDSPTLDGTDEGRTRMRDRVAGGIAKLVSRVINRAGRNTDTDDQGYDSPYPPDPFEGFTTASINTDTSLSPVQEDEKYARISDDFDKLIRNRATQSSGLEDTYTAPAQTEQPDVPGIHRRAIKARITGRIGKLASTGTAHLMRLGS